MTATLWAASGACLVAAAALLVRRARRSPLLELADEAGLSPARRRTRLLWTAMLAVAIAVLAAFAVRARAQGGSAPILKPGTDAIVVVDLSGSALPSSPGIARVLRALTRDPHRHLGLVVFSDAAYEALPPSTSVEGLNGWLALFSGGRTWEYPWAPFASGTSISSGLALARRILRRDHVADPHVVLVSDLADSDSDLQRLATVTAEYQRENIDLRVVRVAPDERPSTAPVSDLPNASFVADAATAVVDPAGGDGDGFTPVVLAALVALLGLLAAANELALHPLTWRTGT